MVVVPGEPEDSLLLSALRHDGLEMPPKRRLPPNVVADFENWILAGAVDPRSDEDDVQQHWAWQPVQHPAPPQLDSDWPRNEIDQFVLLRLLQQQIAPSPQAERTTLLRRLFLDLTGLPPMPEDVVAFDSTSDQDAYEHVVDRLLESSHYGERWGRYWLDMARYADSNGYEADRVRPHAWRWRDWVIDSLNADMPFDEFTIQQIAGDLLPNSSTEQRVATGFHRNTLVNTEGGVDREEDRVKRTVDRTNTVAKVWLGLTLGCCQCHSHKYDPISQHEYYRFYAFFNSLQEPLMPAPTLRDLHDHSRKKKRFTAAHQPYLDAIAEYRSARMTKWEQSISTEGYQWQTLTPDKLSTAAGITLKLEADGVVGAYGPNNEVDTYTVAATTSLSRITAIRLETLADDRLGAGGPGLASNGNFVLTAFRLFAGEADNLLKGGRVKLASARADFSQGNRDIKSALVDNADSGWAIHPQTGMDHAAVFTLAEPIDNRAGTRLTVELAHLRHADHNLGRFRISVTSASSPVPLKLNDADIVRIIRKPADVRTGAEVLRLIRCYNYSEPGLDELVAAETEHRKSAPLSPDTTIMARTVSELRRRRETRVHIRGSFLDKGDLVQAGTPEILPSLVSGREQAGRLDLAKWIVADNNPLTSRVIVNRVWQQYFGRGLVATDDDFGTQGEPPSHPELLDWLANRFRQDNWSLKKLHKLIVMSATYRQSSHVRPKLIEHDPYNTLLARQNRLRVEAEIVRDLALSVSGLLNPQIGGKSVRPPQPADFASLGFQGNVKWPVSEGRDRYRRGLYTFFQRTVPYPMLVDFDVSDSNTSCTQRERSTSPLQALTLWNDPVFVECAQALGRRIIAESPSNDLRDRLRFALRLTMSREVRPAELKTLIRYSQEQNGRFRSDPDKAKLLAGDGPPSGTATDVEVAAWVSVARLLINLDEFITRE